MSYYISCPSCQIGGYDFCPMCCGSGGYLSELEPLIVIISPDKEMGKMAYRIGRFGSIPVLSDLQKTKLNMDYEYLKAVEVNDVTSDLIMRIETIRTRQFRTKLNILVENKFKGMEVVSSDDYDKLSGALMTLKEWKNIFKKNAPQREAVKHFQFYLEKMYEYSKISTNSGSVELKANDILEYVESIDVKDCVKIIIQKNKYAVVSKSELVKFTKKYIDETNTKELWIMDWALSLT